MRRKEYGWLYAQRPVLHEPLFRPEGEVFDEVEKREVKPYDEKTFGKILSCIDSAGARGQVYITGDADVLVTARKMAPDLDRCCLEGDSNYTIVENAVKYGCKRVQFCKMYLTEKMLRDAKENHLICNLFWADDKQEAEEFLKAGIDVVLTNNCLALL